jgi:hypothetical protein
MSNLSLTFSSDRLLDAVRRAPLALERELGIGIGRIIQTIARDARSLAPKGGTSLLTNSIHATQPSPLEGIVAPGVNYARMVEEGTEPGYFPPFDNILDWVKQVKMEPRNPGDDQFDLAWRIVHSIFYTGTVPQPYMQPALENNLAMAERTLNSAIDRALESA